jgi:FkbM family methyltransferase
MESEAANGWMTRADIEMKLVSYAQNAEDILLHRVFDGATTGFYLDAGANDPVFHSVTRLCSGRGWSGINIEPHPTLHRRLCAERPRDINLNVGVSEVAGTLTFYEVPSIHGWSTFMPEMAASYLDKGVEFTERPIPVTTLAEVCERHVDRPIDFLKIDVEGFERQAIAGMDWRRWRPRVVLVEATWPDLWEDLLLSFDYLQAAFDGVNRFYVRAEDRDLLPRFAAPVNVLDNYIPYEYVRLLEQSHPGSDLGPSALEVARRVRRLARRHPGIAAMAKYWLHAK